MSQHTTTIGENSTAARSIATPIREKLAFTVPELCAELGGMHRSSLWKLEKRGLIKSVPGIGRNKVFSVAEVKRFLADKN